MTLYTASYWLTRAVQIVIGAYIGLLIWTALS